MLVFLPGVGEVSARRPSRLGGRRRRRAAAARPAPPRRAGPRADAGARRRVVVSTAVAESSLTVPGRARRRGRRAVPRAAHRPPPRARRAGHGERQPGGGRQRAGPRRARGPGAVYRCWSEAEHAHLAAHPEPEIATADLTSFALEIATWGTGTAGLALIDPPPEAAIPAARSTLETSSANEVRSAVALRCAARCGRARRPAAVRHCRAPPGRRNRGGAAPPLPGSRSP